MAIVGPLLIAVFLNQVRNPNWAITSVGLQESVAASRGAPTKGRVREAAGQPAPSEQSQVRSPADRADNDPTELPAEQQGSFDFSQLQTTRDRSGLKARQEADRERWRPIWGAIQYVLAICWAGAAFGSIIDVGVFNNPPDYLSSTLWGVMISEPLLIAPFTFMFAYAVARSLVDYAEWVRGDVAAHDGRSAPCMHHRSSPFVFACRCTVLGSIVLAILVAADVGPRGIGSRLIVLGCQAFAFMAVWMIRRRHRRALPLSG